jgi:glutamate--cysteine ligase
LDCEFGYNFAFLKVGQPMATRLNTPTSELLQLLEQRILERLAAVEHWFRNQWHEHIPPFYTSVDLRNSGYKIAPVDTNLFPGGFNNLNPDFLPLCVQAVMATIEKICPDVKNMLLIPESHTRNTAYLQNVAVLRNILVQAGLTVRIGGFLPEGELPRRIKLSNGETLFVETIKRVKNRLQLDGFNPCAILLNNDLSSGIPDALLDLEQTILPSVHAGWAIRRKSKHFTAYNGVAQEFAKLLEVDSWLINPYFAHCGQINFQERKGEDCLAEFVDELLRDIRAKYREYAIPHEPYVIIKADAGTYGMAVMTVKSSSEIRNLNRKQRNKMSVIKGGQAVTDAIVQEGIHTFESLNQAVAEPVVYMIDRYVVGGFYRVHTTRNKDENLNSPGMHFEPLAFEMACSTPELKAKVGSLPNRFYTYGVIARLAMLAAAIELEQPQAK